MLCQYSQTHRIRDCIHGLLDNVHVTFGSVPSNSRWWQKKTREFIEGILIEHEFHSLETFRPNLRRSVFLMKNVVFFTPTSSHFLKFEKLMCLESCAKNQHLEQRDKPENFFFFAGYSLQMFKELKQLLPQLSKAFFFKLKVFQSRSIP